MLIYALPLYVVVRPQPFANPVVDLIRMACVVVAVLLVMVSIRLVLHLRRTHRLEPGQYDRFKCMWLSVVSIAYTELIMQGTALTPRLVINAGALFYGLRGVVRMRRQLHPPHRPKG